MGLDFSHGDAHFGYGGFMGFRMKLSDVAGLGELWDYYRREKSFDTVDDVIKMLKPKKLSREKYRKVFKK